MIVSVSHGNGIVPVKRERIRSYAFDNAAPVVNCALLPVICAGFAHLRDICAHFCRIGCLLPHMDPA
jgi:hypothetical protein